MTSRSSAGVGRSRPVQREWLLDDITPVNSSNSFGCRKDDGNRSPIPEFSLVDSLLLSLDQFSLGQVGTVHPTDDQMQVYAAFADDDDDDRRYHHHHHHYSYSSSSYVDDEDSRITTSSTDPGARDARKNDGGRILRNGRWESSKKKKAKNGSGSGMSCSTSTTSMSIITPNNDAIITDTFAPPSKKKTWVNLRPSSFDQGQEQSSAAYQSDYYDNYHYHHHHQYHQYHHHNLDDDDDDDVAAPNPTVPVGPRHRQRHGVDEPCLERSETTTSTRKHKHFRSRSDHDPELHLLPSAFIKEPSPAMGKSKETAAPSWTEQMAAQQTRDRPGFFRRVFGGGGGGSSRSNTVVTSPPAVAAAAAAAAAAAVTVDPSSPHGSTTSHETAGERPRSRHVVTQTKSRLPDTPEPRPSLVKKPSSFFRRRKKSISVSESDLPPPVPTSTVPPLDLENHPAPNKPTYSRNKTPEKSPVSSLRQVMNPYLNSPIKSRTSPLSTPREKDPPAEPLRQIGRGSSSSSAADYHPASKITIRAIPELRESPVVRPHAYLVPTRFEYGSTFSRDPSDNDSSNSPNMKDEFGRKFYIKPTTRSSDMVEDSKRDGSDDAQPDTSHLNRADSQNRLPRPSMACPIQSPEQERVHEWVVASKSKPVLEKAERIVLEPTLEEEHAQNAYDPVPDANNTVVQGSGSTISSDYKSARSVPSVPVEDGAERISTQNALPAAAQTSSTNDTHRALDTCTPPIDEDQLRAKQIFEGNEDFIPQAKAATWLGEEGAARQRTLVAYMELYDFTNLNILAALRMLCGRLVLKAESQQVDRILDVFANRWCECNPHHGFKVTDVVHTICYSIILLNTDLHLADIDQKMTRSQFVKNTMSTVRSVVANNAPDAFESSRPTILPTKSPAFDGETSTRYSTDQPLRSNSSIDVDHDVPSWRLSFRPPSKVNADEQHGHTPTPLDYEIPADDCGPLVKVPFYGTLRTWEVQLEIVLKNFYASIRSERLPLFGTSIEKHQTLQSSHSSLSIFANGMLRRTPSVLSKAASEVPRDPRARGAELARLGTGKWSAKNRSRPRLYANSAMSSSRNSLDDQSSMWSPSVASSTWTKYSLGKTQTSMSVDSYGSTWAQGDYQQSIGFANALSQAIIREETIGSAGSDELRVAPLLEDESLELVGAPWAKEGIVKHKHHLESLAKKAKDRSWNETFAVIEKGYMSLFSFSLKSMRRQAKGKPSSGVGSVVGGGNWQENAESLGSFLLRQTIASALPSPGYSKARPHVWALSLPTGAVHLFQVGTPEIVREFVSTANYWSARLSNHPLVGGISNVEYGWSEAIINHVLTSPIHETSSRASVGRRCPSVHSPRRTSIEGPAGIVRPRLPVDKIHIADWSPPTQSMRASNLMEQDQLNALVAYVKGIEDELQRHNQLRPAVLQAFTPRHANYHKFMANWEKKSSYLLREIVKFRTYIDSLQAAEAQKQRIYAQRAAERALVETGEEENESDG